jgi:hypothetical protein
MQPLGGMLEDDLTFLVAERTWATELGSVEHVASIDGDGVGAEDCS